MSQKLKHRPSFFSLKRWGSQKKVDAPETSNAPSPSQIEISSYPSIAQYKQQMRSSSPVSRIALTSSTARPASPKPRKLSAGGIKELVQCTLCLEVFTNPKMLACQHTFCAPCLLVYIGNDASFACPVCGVKFQVTGPNYVNELPSNLYIDSLLRLVGINAEPKTTTPPVTPETGVQLQNNDIFANASKVNYCSQCKDSCDHSNIVTCEHCKLKFCNVCWKQHVKDMRTQTGSILKQLESAAGKLEHKIEYFKDRCERVVEQINMATEEKLNAIIESKDLLLRDAMELQKSGDLSSLALKTSLNDAKSVAKKVMNEKEGYDENNINTFINLHYNSIQIMSDIAKWDTDWFVFDKESFKIEQDATNPQEAESEDPLPQVNKHPGQFENEESLILYYRSHNFIPHYVWRKTSRPGGVGINPWDNHLYVCGMDTHCVLVVERTQGKIVSRLTCEQMLCPVQIAFMKSLGEIYVTDKWKHCIHVFARTGEHLRTIGQKGSRLGSFRSPEGIATDNAQHLIYVVDTGNDRVQVIQPDGTFLDQIGIIKNYQPTTSTTVWTGSDVTCTELNAPTSVAVTQDRVIILDSGNRRVKVYNKQDKSKIIEFGSAGQRKGQFRQPEVLTVDPMGLIFVGDSGNCRVQIFKQNGHLVRVFGGLGKNPGKFGWISGIHITKEMDIIVSDTKNRNVSFFCGK